LPKKRLSLFTNKRKNTRADGLKCLEAELSLSTEKLLERLRGESATPTVVTEVAQSLTRTECTVQHCKHSVPELDGRESPAPPVVTEVETV
jgi:hypothetical protein